MKKKLICLAAAVSLLAAGCSLWSQKGTSGQPYQMAESDVTGEDQEADTWEETEASGTLAVPETSTKSDAAVTDKATASTAETETEELLEKPVNTIILATDMHYMAQELTDHGPAFTDMVEHGDGKVVPYISEIMEAFLDEVIIQKPGALILSGDVSFEGERLSHEELAGKLRRVKEAGIPVLVIPGNHDINNQWASRYSGIKTRSADNVTPEEFREIYLEYGYEGAVSYDPASLSYRYRLDDEHDLLMLDSCQYEPKNLVGGAIREETYEWIEEQLRQADEEGRRIIPISHHNLLEESEIYVDDCTIEHGEQLARMLEEWNVRIYLSGHLHVQHMKSADDGGIFEIVTSSLATPPCQYGVLDLMEDDSYRYHTRIVDVETWASEHESGQEDLLNFSEFRTPFLERVFFNQAYDQLEDQESGLFDDERMQRMSELYAKLNRYYYAGRAVEIKDSIRNSPYYELWDCEVPNSILPQYIQSILNDANQDYNQAVVD